MLQDIACSYYVKRKRAEQVSARDQHLGEDAALPGVLAGAQPCQLEYLYTRRYLLI